MFKSVKISPAYFLKTTILWVVFLHCGYWSFGQSSHSLLRSGDKFYFQDKFKTAEEEYRKALEKEAEPSIQYNLGNSIYKQNRMEEAIEKYESAVNSASNESLKSKAYHNLGNAYYHNKNYEKSIEAYQQSLLLNPSDLETKENLVRAQKEMRIQQQQQQQQQNQDDKKKDNQDQQQQQQQDQQENEENQNQPQNNQQEQQQDQQQQQDKKKEQPNDLTKREAEKLLDIMDQEEQKVQEKLQKGKNATIPNGKDW